MYSSICGSKLRQRVMREGTIMNVRGAQVLDLGQSYFHTRFHSLILGTSGGELRFILHTQDGPMYTQQFPMCNSISHV